MNQKHIARVEPAHYVKPNEDCMGRSTPGYWRSFAFGTDGECVSGVGDSAEVAEQSANAELMEHERILHLPDKERLKLLLDVDGHICPADQEKALKLMGKILLNS